MNENQQIGSASLRLRHGLLAFAGLLGALAIWQLAAELARPSGVKFTTDAQAAASIYKLRSAAATAARIGIVRGDLWSQAAFAFGDKLLSDELQKSDNGATLLNQNEMAAVTNRAVLYAPYDARLWLLLAASYMKLGLPGERAAGALRMSYYTGSDRTELIPARLLLALRSEALHDAEFQELVRHDIRLALAQKSKFASAIFWAHNNAPPFGREFIEKTLVALDPALLSEGQER
jgi:hypothetical protein